MRVDLHALMVNPHKILQELSIKVFERRRELLDKLIEQKIVYVLNDEYRQGILKEVDGKYASIEDTDQRVRIPLESLIF